MVSVKEVVAALSKCVDPEMGSDIVNLGLIYNIRIDGDSGRDVKVTLTMTSPMCPVISIILADVQLRLEAIQNIGKVDIDLVWDPLWNPEMMSDDLKYASA
ncbi:MAG: metal-sulfur cluster assembly factor [Candidatus Micrarchaeales archaeon]|nr:metal-sulfur cluster assembly factor [Candidatus Micrarchaeales archaeon]